ncbi:hypothetical protein CEXT_411511 [Caerostris extrusa]|uniref:Uncharacterized protein n=1 Tax=Caerostris extrusa TaxID=172846 RepID=A0AAV4QT03_CAEEX|nr:hypothetical protein CEXT_411511 [Caerostris extrusa]
MFIEEKYSLNVPTGPRNTTGMISQSMSIAGTYLLLPLRTRPGVEQAIFLLVHPRDRCLCALRVVRIPSLYLCMSFALFLCVGMYVCFEVLFKLLFSKGTLVMRICGYNRKLAGWSLILT